jgi:hypothetical protein
LKQPFKIREHTRKRKTIFNIDLQILATEQPWEK